MDLISVVVPCFNEEDTLLLYYREMQQVMAAMEKTEFELIFVDDGSRDRTLELMRGLCGRDARCRYISFSRNFGKEAAIWAGLQEAGGDYVATMDVDLQDPPSLLPEMYRVLQEEEYDCAAARRVSRSGEAKLRSWLSQRFYRCANRLSQTEFVSGARDFRLMNRRMLQAVLELEEYSRFSKGIFSWVGFRTKWLPYENVQRSAGETKWPLRQLFFYALEGILGFSTAPLMLSALCGSAFCLLSVLAGVIGLAGFFGGNTKTAVIFTGACLIFLVGGVQLLCTGISSWYLAKTYLEAKHRPVYLIQESGGGKKKNDVLEKKRAKEGKTEQYGTPA